jgi:hypothetical protein
VFSISGARATARCRDGQVAVDLTRPDGTAIADDEQLLVATSDFLAAGGDGAFGKLSLPDGAITFEDEPTIRDAMADVLRKRGGTLRGDDPTIIDPERPRLTFDGKRPLRCDDG